MPFIMVQRQDFKIFSILIINVNILCCKILWACSDSSRLWVVPPKWGMCVNVWQNHSSQVRSSFSRNLFYEILFSGRIPCYLYIFGEKWRSFYSFTVLMVNTVLLKLMPLSAVLNFQFLLILYFSYYCCCIAA